MAKNYIENVAVVGVSEPHPQLDIQSQSHYHLLRLTTSQASGNVGKYIVEELLKTGKHKVTAITREGSTSTIADGVVVKKVEFLSSPSLPYLPSHPFSSLNSIFLARLYFHTQRLCWPPSS